MGIGVFVPLLIHPAEHFHIGIGPYIDTDLSAKLDGQDDAKARRLVFAWKSPVGGSSDHLAAALQSASAAGQELLPETDPRGPIVLSVDVCQNVISG